MPRRQRSTAALRTEGGEGGTSSGGAGGLGSSGGGGLGVGGSGEFLNGSQASMYEDGEFGGGPEGGGRLGGLARARVELTEEELDEIHEKVLRADNPSAPQNVVVFDLRKGAYTEIPTVDHVQTHFEMETKVFHKSSDEAKRQHIAEQAAEDAADADSRLRNEFNFSERATQTINSTTRERGTNTEPPPRQNFKALATQWDIFDTFVADLERMRREKEKQKTRGVMGSHNVAGFGGLSGAGAGSSKDRKASGSASGSSDLYGHSESMVSLLKTMERMVNLNTYQAIAHDYKYLEFPLDKLASNALTGTLMPLWEFESTKVRKRHVTALAWNPEYPDLFAVGFGSYDFGKRRRGRVYCYSLKNPSHPEYAYETESGVMSLDFHAPPHSSLLAVGLYDGSVLVFDVKLRTKDPLFRSTIRNGKHTDPVWQVQWQEDDLSKKHNFFSVSSDGRVTSWTMIKSELVHTDIIELQLVDNVRAAAADEEASLFGLAGGLCFDFNHTFEHLFIVGTEEGHIHKCSKAYNAQYLETYEGHTMAVYNVAWNTFHPRLFISCSADWTVKVWDHAIKTPLMSFDLNNSVGDVAWAPYSSTVFAACTADGKVFVYDLAVNKHEPMCEQKVARKTRLTHIAFNPDPDNFTLIVGDDKGVVRSFRLSPNLRQIAQIEEEKPQSLLIDAPLDVDLDNKPKKKPKTRLEIEIERLDAIFTAQNKSITMIA